MEYLFQATGNFSKGGGCCFVPAVAEEALYNVVDSDATAAPERVVFERGCLADALPDDFIDIFEAFKPLALAHPVQGFVVVGEGPISPGSVSF